MAEFIKETTTNSVDAAIAKLNSGVFGERTLVLTSDYTLTYSDLANYTLVLCDPTSNDIDVILPDQGSTAGLSITIRNSKGSATYVVNVVAGGSDKITVDEMTTIEMPEAGNYGKFMSSSVTSSWEILDEAITSELELQYHGGWGSTDNYILKYSNSYYDRGNMFTHNHGNYGVHGLDVTIARSGRYAIYSTVSNSSGSAGDSGLSLDSTELTTSVSLITQTDIISWQSNDNYRTGWGIGIKRFNKDGVIRPHTSGLTPYFLQQQKFFISYLGQ